MTFGAKFRAIRTQKRLSLEDVQKRCGVHRSTVWRAEIGPWLPKGKNMRAMCLKGLGLEEDSAEFQALSQAFMTARSGVVVDPGNLAKTLSSAIFKGNKEAEQFFMTVAKMSAEDYQQISNAVQRPGVMAVIRAANAIYESKK